MNGDPEQITEIEQSTVETLSHRRILTEMAAVIVFGAAGSFIFVSAIFGIGVLIGGSLSLVNYYWLKQSLKSIFEQAAAGEKPQFLGARYFLRYLTFAVVLAVVYLTKTVPVIAVLSGLASFALAIIIEALFRLFSSFFNTKEI